jgi:mono/diheme cytochrome c family protein
VRSLALLLLLSALAFAQDLVSRGADIYNKSCAGYCHGVKGAAGGAPRLASRGFDEAYITQVVRTGVPGTAMPAFGATLSRIDMVAVVSYVGSLNGVAPSRNPIPERGPPPRTLPPDAMKGRALFYDAVRGFGRCATCHQVDGMGIAITDPIVKIPESAAALRSLATPKVATVTAEGESFPALVLSKSGKVYDLTKPPPVLRTFPKDAAKIQEGSPWQHGSAIASYSDPDLDAILSFLRAVIHP